MWVAVARRPGSTSAFGIDIGRWWRRGVEGCRGWLRVIPEGGVAAETYGGTTAPQEPTMRAHNVDLELRRPDTDVPPVPREAWVFGPLLGLGLLAVFVLVVALAT